MTSIDSPDNHKNIPWEIQGPYPDYLKRVWSEGDRPWHIYSKEQFRRFWDKHNVEHRGDKK